jgi:putative two-component system response regulator
MPGMDGLELLGRLKQLPQTRDIPFVILTAHHEQELRRKSLDLGATDLLNKPTDPEDLIARVNNALRLKFQQDELKRNNLLLEDRVQQRTVELGNMRLEVIWRLAKAAELRDEETGNHIFRVALISRAIGREMALDPDFLEQLFVTAPLHDIGKIGVPDSILLKPGKLTASEWEIMKQHCAIGARILRDECRGTHALRASLFVGREEKCQDPLLQMASSIAFAHHEKWNGGGYPQGLAGEQIPLEARIVALADVYDALTSDRPYKRAYTHGKSVDTMRHGVATHFDPEVFAAFEVALDEIEDIKLRFADQATPDAFDELAEVDCLAVL